MISPTVTAILSLRSSLPPCSDELRKRVQSIRVRSAQDSRETRGSAEGNAWRHKTYNSSHGSHGSHGSHLPNTWRTADSPNSPSSPGLASSGSNSPGTSLKFRLSQSPEVPRSIHRPPSFQNSLNQMTQSPTIATTPMTPISTSSTPSGRYVSRFHNGSKTGDDQILNTVILNKLNIFSVKTYEDVKQFLFQILGSDQKEFIREFTWLVFRKAAAEEKFCPLFAKLLSEIQKEYPVILEEMRNLHTTYLDIWNISDSTNSKVDRRCRLGYSQFLAELTALSVLESDTMRKTLETLKKCISECLSKEEHVETVEEYMDCLRQLCGSKVPKPVRKMICDILMDDLESWIAIAKGIAPGLSTKSRFSCMDLRDLLKNAI